MGYAAFFLLCTVVPRNLPWPPRCLVPLRSRRLRDSHEVPAADAEDPGQDVEGAAMLSSAGADMAETEHRAGPPDGTKPAGPGPSPDIRGPIPRAAADAMASDRAGPDATTIVKAGTSTSDRPARRLVLRLVVRGFVLASVTLAVVLGPSLCQAWQEGRHRLNVPPSLDGLVLDESPAVPDTIDQLRDALETGIPLRSSVGAGYTDSARPPRSVIFVWGTGSFASPEASLDAAFAISVGDAIELEESRSLPAWSLDIRKCGVIPAEGAATSVCGWADRATLGIGLFRDRGVAESAELLQSMRHAIRPSG